MPALLPASTTGCGAAAGYGCKQRGCRARQRHRQGCCGQQASSRGPDCPKTACGQAAVLLAVQSASHRVLLEPAGVPGACALPSAAADRRCSAADMRSRAWCRPQSDLTGRRSRPSRCTSSAAALHDATEAMTAAAGCQPGRLGLQQVAYGGLDQAASLAQAARLRPEVEPPATYSPKST